MNFLLALLPILAGFTEPLKKWFETKQALAAKEQDYKLAVLSARTAQAVAEAESDTQQNRDRLQATSQDFKQGTWYFLCGIILLSVLMPSKAAVMWQNFALIPLWFQNLFVGVTLVIWGINPVKNGALWLTDKVGSAVDARRQYKLDRAAIFASLKKTIFIKGLNQQQTDAVDAALDEGEK